MKKWLREDGEHEKKPNNTHILLTTLSDSKSNRLHVDIFRFFFYLLETHFINFSKTISNSLEVSNFNRLYLKLHRFICNQPPSLPRHRPTLAGGSERSSPIHYYAPPTCLGGPCHRGALNEGCGFVGRPHPSHPFTAPHPTVYETSQVARKKMFDGWKINVCNMKGWQFICLY